jgi:imidazole glycerol-phosphate synthase subunit HisH
LSTPRAVIIASGGANIASLQFALQRLGVQARLSADPADIRAATHVLLPGVGAAGDAMQRLRSAALDELIPRLTQPVLGICLGMQLLFERSEENGAECLGIIAGSAARLPGTPGLPVPHMGWNTVAAPVASPLLTGIETLGGYAYFVHSYAVGITRATIGVSHYGIDFSAAVQRDNFYGTQFHPERSAKVGARVLENFLAMS